MMEEKDNYTLSKEEVEVIKALTGSDLAVKEKSESKDAIEGSYEEGFRLGPRKRYGT